MTKKIQVHRKEDAPARGVRVDPTVIRPRRKVGPPCLPCASGGRGEHTCARRTS